MFVVNLFWSQLFTTIPSPTASYADKTVIVTGSNTGLGFEAAKHFVRLGAALVILAVRNESKGLAAKAKIVSSAERDDASSCVEVWPLDLQSFESVKAFAKRAEGLKRIDVLLENAAITTFKFELAEDNETQITTNVVSTFLLAMLLLPKLRETANKYNTQPHLSVVTSEMYEIAKFSEKDNDNIFDALSDPKKSNMSDRYATSKLIGALFLRELVDQIASDKSKPHPQVVINFVTPGFCLSELRRDIPSALKGIIYIMELCLARSTEVGSRTLVHAVSAGEESHGRYLRDCSVWAPTPWEQTEEGAKIQKRVYRELMAKLEKISPGIEANV